MDELKILQRLPLPVRKIQAFSFATPKANKATTEVFAITDLRQHKDPKVKTIDDHGTSEDQDTQLEDSAEQQLLATLLCYVVIML